MSARIVSSILALLLSLTTAAETRAQAGEPNFENATSFEVADVSDDFSIAADGLDLRVQGQPQTLLSIDRLPVSQVVLYFDLPLATEVGVESAAQALADHAEALVAAGPVHVIVGDVVADVLVSNSRDAEHLRQALEEVAGMAVEAGTARELRTALLAAGLDGDEDFESTALELLDEEYKLLQWQRQTLLEQLSTIPGKENRVLFLVQDGFDLSPLEELAEDIALSARFERRAPIHERSFQRDQARTLAADGWLVVPLALSLAGLEVPAGAAEAMGQLQLESPLRSRAVMLAEWSAASGSRVVTDPSALAASLSMLKHRYRARWRTSQLIDTPAPVDLLFTDPNLKASWRRWTTSVVPGQLISARAEGLLGELINEGESALLAGIDGSSPELSLRAVLLDDGSGENAILQVQWQSTESTATGGRYRFTLATQGVDSAATSIQLSSSGEAGSSGEYQTQVPLIDDFESAVLIVEELTQGQWGVTSVELGDRSLAPAPSTTQSPVRTAAVRPGTQTTPSSGRDPRTVSASGPVSDATTDNSGKLLQIVPPQNRNLQGKVEFKVLLTNPVVQNVQFLLDGKEVAMDRRPPFGASIDLGDSVRPQRIEVVGSSDSGIELGRDRLDINQPVEREGIKLTQLATRAEGGLDVAATVKLPEGETLDRVEFYRNQQLISTLTRPPFQAVVPGTPGGPTDFIRVVAWSKNERFFEDVRMLSDSGLTDQVEVNLVQVYAIVTDRNGDPVEGLEQGDFKILRGGREQTIERFGSAEETSLRLGLVIDTSGSMEPIMPQTRKAAARFLSETLTSIDRGFVVDFANQPRLAHGVTGDVFELLSTLGSLRAEGSTALYDSIVFSLLQFGRHRGRDALVVLSDGDDYQSRFGFRRAWQDARASGIPVYVLELSGLDPGRPSFRKDDLEVIAEDSGGRVFYATSVEDITRSYAIISRELRNQYVLGFSSDRSLDLNELGKIEVEVPGGKRYKVRTSVGQR